jgi:hypothetical protein
MRTPTLPTPGQNVKTWARMMRQFVRANQVTGGPGVSVSRWSGGTTVHAVRRPAKRPPEPEHNHSWHFAATSATGGIVTLGRVEISGGVKSVTGFPTDGILSGVTSSTLYWIAIDASAATATWASRASVLGYPSSTDTVEIWPILEITCASSVITAVCERMQSDIHVTKMM